MQKPLSLKPGNTIGIAAPASSFDATAFGEGVKTLEGMGFKVHFRPDIFDRSSYLAGRDARRAAELIELIENPDIDAILFARGGYGMMRLLPALDQYAVNSKPKIILGYSDITTFLIYVQQRYGWSTFYGPVVAKDLSANAPQENKQHLLNALTCLKPLGPFTCQDASVINQGVCEGELTGGCLSLVVASLGTPYEIDTRGKILFLEDTNEKAYSIDRMMTQLILAGKLKEAKGVLLGNFVNGSEITHIRETFIDVLKDFKCPVLFDFPAGHGPLKITLPLGVNVRLTAHEKTLEYLEPACR